MECSFPWIPWMETLRCLNFACSLLVKSTNASLLHSMVLTQRLNKSAVTKEKEHVRVTKVWCGAWDTKGYITKAPKVNALRSNGQAVATRVCTLIFLSTKALKMGTEWGIHCCKQTCANKATSRTRRATIHKNSLHAAATSLTYYKNSGLNNIIQRKVTFSEEETKYWSF